MIHLHVHSQYSILDATPSVKSLASSAAKHGMPALALTDHGNLYGAIDFYKACKAEGVKPIIGSEVYVAPNSCFEKSKSPEGKTAHHLTLLAKNKVGYHNLCRLVSIGFLEGFYYRPRVDLEMLEKYSEGLICLSGCMNSPLSQAILTGDREKIKKTLEWHQRVFGEDFYLEVMRHKMSDAAIQEDGLTKESWLQQYYEDAVAKQDRINQVLVNISPEVGVPIVATNDVHYINRDDWKAHEILLNIQSGEPVEVWELDSLGNPKFRKPNPKRRSYPSHECYFKSSEEMSELFSDLPEAISNTRGVADKCNVELDFDTKHYPVFVPPSMEKKHLLKKEREKEVVKFLWGLCEEGIKNRYTEERLAKVQEIYPGRNPMEVVRERLQTEMEVIAPKGLCDYLLIVWDFIHWAKREKIPVGPGRGSGAGSIVLYLIGITDIEPLRFSLFFERFINPERPSYPDIDVDICMDGRADVINYTLNKYGADSVAQIITFGTMKAKMVIRDVGRALNVPLKKVNELAKLVPDDLNITLDKALEMDPDFRKMTEQDEESGRIVEIGKRLEGSVRNTGIHAAGIIVSGDPLTDHIPICSAKDSEIPATQYSMKPVEQVGMLKIDFLGLKTLTCIKLATGFVKTNYDVDIDWMNLHLDDQPTYDMLNQGKTMGVFQLESGGMSDLARQLHLDKFEEIIAVGALYRPGPMDMIPSFINRKHKREPIEYDHPWMKEILDETYGIMVYQEQVMQIAQKLANYSLGEGDVLRRAMGKKDAAEMANQREKFRAGCIENGIDDATATSIFDKMEKFAAYGFNKSHATAYAYLSYVTAFFKANYPKEWLSALMTAVRDDITKVSKFIRETQAMGFEVLPPDVNESTDTFIATERGIRFALSAIKGVGTATVEAIVEERQKNGPYKNLYDFTKRVDLKRVGKKNIESIVDAGGFDFTGWSRDALRISVESMYDVASKSQKEASQGYMSLFDAVGDANEERFNQLPVVPQPSTKTQLLFKEKELLGFFLTGHPMDEYREIMQRLSCVPLRKIDTKSNGGSLVRSAIIIDTVTTRFSKKSGKKFAILVVSDGLISYELPVWPEMFEQNQELIRENQLLYAILQVEVQGADVRMNCRWMADLTQASERMIDECDSAFDQAKKQMERMQFVRSRAKQEAAKKEDKPMEKAPTLALTLNADQLRLSHIIQLRDLFTRVRGSSPVTIDFKTSEGSYASLDISSKWGVELTDKVKSELKAMPFINSMEAR